MDTSSPRPAPIIADNNRVQVSQNGRIALIDPTILDGQQNMCPELKQYVNSSINYNAALLGFSLVKAVTAGSILIYTTSLCSKFLIDFAIYMIIHDVSYIFTLFLKIQTMIKGTFAYVTIIEDLSNLRQQHPSEQIHLNFVPQTNDGGYIFAISDEAEKKNNTTYAIAIISKVVYYALFFYGQFLYYYYPPTCVETDTSVRNLILFYIISGYIYIGMPIIFVAGTCLCLPFVMLWAYLFGEGNKTPVTTKLINKLPVFAFKESLPGNHECSICIVEYKLEDKIIQLKCSPMHHFHADCLKKWLKINGLCPVCRHSVFKDAAAQNKDEDASNNNPN